MGCCQSRRDDVWVSEACRVRFPALKTAPELMSLIRYAVGKTQQGMGSMPGTLKRDVAASVIDLLVKELATPELALLYEQLGGRAFVEHSIDLLCSAQKRGRTAGV